MLTPDSPRCCVVIPAYNEAEHLPALLAEVFQQQSGIAPYELWVVVVDDNSPDGSDRVLAELSAIYPRLTALHGPKLGLGIAYQRGFAHALEHLRPELLMQMDSDFQHDPKMLPTLVRHCQPGVAAVVGSRFAPGASTPYFSWR
ncbi:MAG: glycosyltransferase, partial [Streptosporangiaceae bacterium]